GDPPKIKGAGKSLRRRIPVKVRWIFVIGLFVVLLGIVGNDIWVGVNAAEVADAVETRELEELSGVWDRYDDLARQAYLQIATTRLRRSLTQRSAILADRVIANYRTSLPTVREPQWRAARDALARAVSLEPRDQQLRASLRYCEGHLH